MEDGVSEKYALLAVVCRAQHVMCGGEGFLDEFKIGSVDVSVEEHHLRGWEVGQGTYEGQ